MSTPENFYFKAMADAQGLAEQLARLRTAAWAAKDPRVTQTAMVRTVGALLALAAKVQADAELDCKYMEEYVFQLGADDRHKFKQLMAVAEVAQIQR